MYNIIILIIVIIYIIYIIYIIHIDGLNVNELTVFFGNIFNTLILHAIIINAKKGMLLSYTSTS